MKKFLIALISLSTLTAWSLQPGENIANFSVPGADGKTHQLSDYKGKTVVLEWFNNDCPFVKKHYDAGNMQALQEAHTKNGGIWFTVASSAPGKQGHVDKDTAAKLIADRAMKSTTILFDHDGKLGHQFGAKTTPHMFIINAKGSLVYQGAIDSDSSTKAESLKTAQPWFKDALTASQNGKPVAEASTKPYGCSVKYAPKAKSKSSKP